MKALSGRPRSDGLHRRGRWGHVLSAATAAPCQRQSAGGGARPGTPRCAPQTETRSCHRYALRQRAEPSDPAGSRQVSAAFPVELMRRGVPTPSERHVEEARGARATGCGVAGAWGRTCTRLSVRARLSLPEPGGRRRGGPQPRGSPGRRPAGALCPGSPALPRRSETGTRPAGIQTCRSPRSASRGKKPCPGFSLSSGLCTF